MTKEKAELDEWCKTIAPSTELRTWYHHDPQRFTEFTRRYHDELTQPERAEALAHLRILAKDRNLTLLTASKAVDISRSHRACRDAELSGGAATSNPVDDARPPGEFPHGEHVDEVVFSFGPIPGHVARLEKDSSVEDLQCSWQVRHRYGFLRP